MPISQSDKEFMEQVAAYFRSTKSPQAPGGSIRDTALHFNINRNKVRKILITMGELKSPISDAAVLMRRKGMSIKEIADKLGVSAATVSTALPYEDKVDNTLEPTDHARDVREYRAYEREQMKRQAGRVSSEREQMKHQAGRDSKNQETSQMRNEKTMDTGKMMPEQNTNEKEWQKDIKMSYTETYHRPHRSTWEDIEGMKRVLEAELTDDSPEELKELLAGLNSMDENLEAEEQELEKFLSKKRLTKDEKSRLTMLRFITGQFPGALNNRNRKVLEQIAGNRLPPEPMSVIRLHMELYNANIDGTPYIDDKQTAVFRKYGKLEYGDNISRDIIVPGDIPLYALHYVIQRAFGWQNSHLRKFELPENRFRDITDGNTLMWSKLVGVLFRSPLMDEDDEFWADDYRGGSFKNWLRRKYTGPYLSQCHGEGIISCRKDMEKEDMDDPHYVMYAKAYNRETERYDGEEIIGEVRPVYDYKGNKLPAPKPWHSDKAPYRVEVMSFKDIPSEGLRFVYDRNPMALLERLPISCVLATGKFSLPEDSGEEERKYIEQQIVRSGDVLYRQVEGHINSILEEKIDSPDLQAEPEPVTDILLYNYDFGDDWMIRITASENCPDLVESGRITQTELDRANVKCREVYRPVLIARDGEMLMDDVGGLHGFADFLETINPELKGMLPEDKEEAKEEKRKMLVWAKSLGWHRERTSDFNLL